VFFLLYLFESDLIPEFLLLAKYPGRIFCLCSDDKVLCRMKIRLATGEELILMFNGRLDSDISCNIFARLKLNHFKPLLELPSISMNNF
jgi:hypothetical protein